MGLDIKAIRLCKTDPGEVDPDDYRILEEDEVMQFKNAGLSDKVFTRMETFDKQVSVVYYGETIGYQRKGMNEQFYKDYDAGKLNYFVLDKATLEMYMETYVVDGMKEHFQENIIDQFIEGETVAIFSW